MFDRGDGDNANVESVTLQRVTEMTRAGSLIESHQADLSPAWKPTSWSVKGHSINLLSNELLSSFL